MKKILASLCTIFLFSNIVTSAKAEINFLIGTWAEEPLTPFVEAFEKETGIEVNIQTFPFRDLLATIEVRGNAQADDVDVIFVDAPLVPSYAVRGMIGPMDQYFADTLVLMQYSLLLALLLLHGMEKCMLLLLTTLVS